MAMTFETAADLVQRLGNIPLERICFTPPPGTATERDLLAAMRRSDRLYELVDGTLVEKAMGLSESMIALLVSRRIGNFAEEHDLGIPAGADGTVRLLKGLVRVPDVSFFCWDKLPGRVLPSEPIPDLFPDLAVEGPQQDQHARGDGTQTPRILPGWRSTRLDDRPAHAHSDRLHRPRRSRRHARRDRGARWRHGAARLHAPAGRIVRAPARRTQEDAPVAQKETLSHPSGPCGER